MAGIIFSLLYQREFTRVILKENKLVLYIIGLCFFIVSAVLTRFFYVGNSLTNFIVYPVFAVMSFCMAISLYELKFKLVNINYSTLVHICLYAFVMKLPIVYLSITIMKNTFLLGDSILFYFLTYIVALFSCFGFGTAWFFLIDRLFDSIIYKLLKK